MLPSRIARSLFPLLVLGLSACKERTPIAATQPISAGAIDSSSGVFAAPLILVPWSGSPATQPTRISLHIQSDRSDVVAQQLSKQLLTRVSISSRQPTSRPFQFAADDLPYATAVAEMLSKTGLSPVDSEGALVLSTEPPLQVIQLGDQAALVVSHTELTSTVIVNSPQPFNYLYQIQMMLITDPALRIIGSAHFAVPESIDFDGMALISADSDNWQPSLGMQINPQTTWPVMINFVAGRQGHLIRRLTFSVHCLQVAQEATVTVNAADLHSGKAIGDDVLRVTPAWEKRADGDRLSLILSGRAAEPYFDRRWQNRTWDVVAATDRDQKPLALRPEVAAINAAAKTITVRITPASMRTAVAELKSLKITMPLSMRVINVPVEIRDLPLP